MSLLQSEWIRRIRRYLPFIVILLVLVGVGYCIGPQKSQPDGDLKTIPPLPQHPQIRVAFNQTHESVYTDPYRNIQRYGVNLEDFVIQEINSAQKTIDIAVQELNLPLIAQALASRKKAGVTVRFITENTYTRPWNEVSDVEESELDEREKGKLKEYQGLVDLNRDGNLSDQELDERDIYRVLKKADIPWIDDTADGSKGSGLMHHKFVVIDGKKLVMGSANFTLSDMHGDFEPNDSRGNTNHLIRFDNAEIAQIYTDQFNLLWGDGPGKQTDSLFGTNKPDSGLKSLQVGDTAVSVHFSPDKPSDPYAQSSNGYISQELAKAQKSVDLALFVFSDQGIVDQLEQLQSTKKVSIRGAFDPGFAYRDYSRTLDMWGLILPSRTCKLQAARQAWKLPLKTIGVPNIPQTDKLHHKFGLVDANTSQATVITGSHNWTKAANTLNDENLVIIQNPVVAAHFAREMDRLLTDARMGPPKSLLDKIEKQKKQCPNPTIAADPSESKPKSPPKPAPVTLTNADPIARPKSDPNLNSGIRVNLNTATQAELESLPGVGPGLAARIIAARPIQSLADLDQVSGVGPAKLAQLKDQVTW